MKKCFGESGQTLLEMVVALAIIILLITGVIVAATNSLKTARYSQAKSLSVHYAQEAMEIMRTIRDKSWATFSTYGGELPKVWCMDKNGVLSAAAGTCPFTIDNKYNRTVTATWQDPKMKVETLVTWSEGSQNYQTSLTTYFTQWR